MLTTEENRKRYGELDIVRAISLLFLPIIHVFEEMEAIDTLSPSALSSCRWVLSLCVYAPSVFMICFGANLYFAKEKTPAEYAKRGVKFLLIGVSLNVVRFLLPALIFGNPEEIKEGLYCILECDIYDFVGAFLLVFALFKKLKLSDFTMLIVSMIMLLINTLLPPIHINSALDCFLGRFIYVNYTSCFPILSWTIFCIIGYCFGKIYRSFQKEQDRKKFLIRLMIFGYVMYCALYYTFKSYHLDPYLIELSPENSYITDYSNVMMLVCIAGMVIPIVYFVYMRWSESKPIKALLRLSNVIMPFYLFQWILVGWMEESMVAFNFPNGSIGTGAFYAISIGITLVTILLAKVFGEKFNKLLK